MNEIFTTEESGYLTGLIARDLSNGHYRGVEGTWREKVLEKIVNNSQP